MRILMQIRPDAHTCPGGDTVQMQRTAEFLRRRGHHASVSASLSADLAGIELVFLFNLTRPFELFEQVESARRQGRPYVLSPIYWDLDAAVPWRAYEFPRNWLRRLLPARALDRIRAARAQRAPAGSSPRSPQRALDRHRAAPPQPPSASPGDRTTIPRGDIRAMQAAALAGAQLIFPNSNAEKQHLLERFPDLPPDRLHVVYNGVDEPTDLATADAPGPGGYLLCAGAIGPRKNQLSLVRAFRELPAERLLILGPTAPGCRRYRRAVERQAGPNVEFQEAVPHAEMGRYIRAARAVVQPSYIETPGLAAMEAAAAGVPIVVSSVAPVREYFGDLAHYCDPCDPASIARACAAAVRDGPRDAAAFARRFAWSEVLRPLGDLIDWLAGRDGRG